MTATRIPDLDQWLRDLTAGLPREPRQYEFRCHPDVFLAIREAADVEPWTPPDGYAAVASPVFGGADVRVQAGLDSGCWELYEDGHLRKTGRLGEAVPG